MSALERQCGAVILGGFAGPDLPSEYAAALAQGRRAGAILFRRNLPSLEAALELTTGLLAASGDAPFIALDQEGGRVRRLGAPLLELPPMRLLGQLAAGELRALGCAVGRELKCAGFNLNFAPVLDVDSNPDNPVIGDRAFSADPARVAEAGLALAQGLLDAGVIPCGKHFPGHGDTHQDSHLALPHLPHSLERLERVELVPFRAACASRLPSLMTAHIVFEALDSARPATLSPRVLSGLLREELGFRGVVFSDCLEMQAISAHGSVAEAAVLSIAAGADVVLICHDFARQEAAFEALLKEAESSPVFSARLIDAARRSSELRTSNPPSPEPEKLQSLFAEHTGWQERLRLLEHSQRSAAQTETATDPTEP